MKAVLNQHKNIPLSDKDVIKLVDGKAKIIVYSELGQYSSLEELLSPYGAIFLLYETKKDFGHWVAVFEVDENTVEYFDSYGKMIDYPLEYVPKNLRKVLNEDYPHLTSLFYYSKYKYLTYNHHKFQKSASNIQTCGRWAALRIVFKNIKLDTFIKLFKSRNSDDLVTVLTMPDLDYK